MGFFLLVLLLERRSTANETNFILVWFSSFFLKISDNFSGINFQRKKYLWENVLYRKYFLHYKIVLIVTSRLSS